MPDEAKYSQDESGIVVTWSKGNEGDAAIQGYVIEGLGGQGNYPNRLHITLLWNSFCQNLITFLYMNYDCRMGICSTGIWSRHQ